MMNTIFIAFTLKNSSVANFFVTLSNFLARENNVVIFSHANEGHDFVLNESVTILKWPSKRPTKFRDLKFLMKQMKTYRPKTIIGNFAAVNIFMLGGFIWGVKNRIAWYHTLTTQLEHNLLLKYRKKIFYKMATKIVANSEAARTDLVNSFHIEHKKIEVISNAVKNPLKTGTTNNNKIVFAGRLHQVKGIETLVKALAIVKEEFENIELIVIGDDEGTGHLQKLKDLQKQLCLEENIFFMGNQSRSFVLDQFSSAYCTIVPSFFEAFGYVVIESFSVHTPVIGSDTTGVSEIIKNHKDGLLFTPGDHIELSKKIIHLKKDENLRNWMAENCYTSFLEKFELNKVVKNFAENEGFFS